MFSADAHLNIDYVEQKSIISIRLGQNQMSEELRIC
jgi:hypothetical protein